MCVEERKGGMSLEGRRGVTRSEITVGGINFIATKGERRKEGIKFLGRTTQLANYYRFPPAIIRNFNFNF